MLDPVFRPGHYLTRVSIDRAQEEWPDLIEDPVHGGHVVSSKDEKDVAEIVPVSKAKPKPQFGSAKGLISIGEDFDAPIPDFNERAPRGRKHPR